MKGGAMSMEGKKWPFTKATQTKIDSPQWFNDKQVKTLNFKIEFSTENKKRRVNLLIQHEGKWINPSAILGGGLLTIFDKTLQSLQILCANPYRR
jgi:hypothetical protein